MKSVKTIKIDILNKFRVLEGDHCCLPALWLEFSYKKQLIGDEREMFNRAVGELMRSGIVEPSAGDFDSLCLTDKGIDLIYS